MTIPRSTSARTQTSTLRTVALLPARPMRTVLLLGTLIALPLLPTIALATFDSGSNGSDGSFQPMTSTTIDLALAGSGAGFGTYDPELWVVVFHYTDIVIPTGVHITFSPHPSGAPIVWLVSGDATINGFVRVEGSSGNIGGAAGPGGFPGGTFNPKSRGYGPGGGGFPGVSRGSGGSYGTHGASVSGSTVYPPYGNEQVIPLIGGSGGAPSASGAANLGGGGGGGAILIAASGTLTVDGTIRAAGGNGYASSPNSSGGGSGGAVRLLATTLAGTGSLEAYGGSGGSGYGNGGQGRIRVEAEVLNLAASSTPAWTYDLTPGPVFQDTTTPSVRVATIDGHAVTSDPMAGIGTIDHNVSASGSATLGIEATNVPVGTIVGVYLVRHGVPEFAVASTPLTGSLALSTATATVEYESLVSTETYLYVDW